MFELEQKSVQSEGLFKILNEKQKKYFKMWGKAKETDAEKYTRKRGQKEMLKLLVNISIYCD